MNLVNCSFWNIFFSLTAFYRKRQLTPIHLKFRQIEPAQIGNVTRYFIGLYTASDWWHIIWVYTVYICVYSFKYFWQSRDFCYIKYIIYRYKQVQSDLLISLPFKKSIFFTPILIQTIYNKFIVHAHSTFIVTRWTNK